ncbi:MULTISPECIES: ATPase, T2SS/T4P/T4SS family [Pseudomonas syringae group]|uniref:Bacterial type II secretion system protein E domain-containing protein n=1 Tax=Pseudomonas cannabina TaxID=86840 RepID=A0A3M3LQ72_PSECA|nr:MULTISPECIES: ATPase, T2SS/T4P/T4SS family [Pseudomonas syringae group]MDH4602441.1 Flp pilus assembly complex ATPase component TadA [Pseudomonas syringae pv. papulans]RMN37402.1 hypothetical protein ALQ64_01973 [Pseudomonas cannabina]
MDSLGSIATSEDSKLGATKPLGPPQFNDPPKITTDTLNVMLNYCLANGVEDLLMLVGDPWCVIWSDRVVRLGQRALYLNEIEDLICEMTGNTNAAITVSRCNDLDFTYILKVGRNQFIRWRCNVTGCLGPNGSRGMELVMRPVGKVPKTMDQLQLPAYIVNAAMPKTGIVIITGPTGSGKTTALDAMLHAQATHPDGKHIITYYSPIENDLNAIPNRTGLIAQTEIGEPGFGAHLPSYEKGGRNSLRRHPMVLAYGEARDRVTIDAAVRGSITGHVCYTTTHTPSVHMTIQRMADEFKGSDRIRISTALIDNTRLIFHQRLLKTPSGVGRTPVRSALALTRDMRSHLLKERIEHLPAAMMELTDSEGIGLLADATRQYQAGLLHEDEMVIIEAELASERDDAFKNRR